MTSFSIQNFGCRVNQAEAFEWAARFQESGWTLAGDPAAAGLVIVNTCTLTARADRDARKFIRKAAREYPGARILVTGCLAEREAAALKRMDGVWRVVPNRDKDGLAGELLGEFPAATPSAAPARFRARAFLKVQDGCDWGCSFCVIPSVRGPSASVHLEHCRGRVRALAGEGYREIVLTGIHLCSYGRDLDPRTSLLDLLRAVEAEDGDFSLRLSSLDPRLLAGDLIEHIASAGRIRPHFHLSLQHASSSVLKAMGREGSAGEHEELLRRLARINPEAALGADVLVGFPGETDADFEKLETFLRLSPLAFIHVFAFSPRPGTAAEGRPGVDAAVRSRRAARIRALAALKNLGYRRRFLGRVLDGVVIRAEGGDAEVLTANGIPVRVPAGAARRGEAARVRLVAALMPYSTGTLE